MPFPLVSHQGLAAPALLVGRRRRLDAVAYLVGTLAPDLPYALDRSRWDFDAISHELVGVVVWAIPVAVVASWVFRRFMAEPLATVVPDLGRLRLRDVAHAAHARPAWWVTVVSAGLGALTHLVFDGLTHPEPWAVSLLPVLEDPAPVSLPSDPIGRTYWYDVVHAVADATGVALAVVFVDLGARRRVRADRPRPDLPPPTPEQRRLLGGAVAAGVVVGLVAVARVWWIETLAQATMLFTWSVAMATLGGCLLVRSSLHRMARRTETLLAGEYFLAIQGLAMIRHCTTHPSRARARVEEVREIVARFDELPNSLAIEMTEHDVADGYSRWAPRYDGPNPAIAAEEPIVHGLLAGLPAGTALDAACGTGRHAAKLVELGHRVVGMDATEAMLDVARAKVPGVDLCHGRLEALPFEDGSVDLVTCALALTHVPELAPVIQELARVLRPGGHAVLSDMHPMTTMTSGIAGFPEDITSGIPYVVNLTHQVSDYIAAFNAAGLVIRDCIEPLVTDEVLRSFPGYALYPEATRQAYLDTPYLLIWHLVAGE